MLFLGIWLEVHKENYMRVFLFLYCWFIVTTPHLLKELARYNWSCPWSALLMRGNTKWNALTVAFVRAFDHEGGTRVFVYRYICMSVCLSPGSSTWDRCQSRGVYREIEKAENFGQAIWNCKHCSSGKVKLVFKKITWELMNNLRNNLWIYSCFVTCPM